MRSSAVEPYSSIEVKTRGLGSPHPFDSRMSSFNQPDQQVAQPSMPVKRHLTLMPAEGWLPMGLLAVAVYSLVFSIISANYVGHTFILLLSTAAGLLVGLLIAKIRRVPQSIMHLAACLIGHWLSIWLTSVVAFHTSWLLLLENLRLVLTGGFSATATPSSDVVFLFYLSFLCFFLGYFGAWLTYHAHLPWLVALVYCSILLANLSYVQQDESWLVFPLLIALLLLVARVHLAKQLAQWKSQGLHTDQTWLRGITLRCMQIASVLTLLVFLVSWLLPIGSQPQVGVNFWNQLDNAWSNILHGHASFQNPGTILLPYQTPINFFDDRLTISGSVALPTGEVLYYTGTSLPQYLEGFSYDRFDGHTWTTTFGTNKQSFGANTLLPADTLAAPTTSITTTVTIMQPPEGVKHYIFAPAQPSSFDVATDVYGNDTMSTAWAQQSPLVSGERYKVTSNLPTHALQDLTSIPLPQDNSNIWRSDPNYVTLQSYYLQLPKDLSSMVGQTTLQWTSGATNAYTALKLLENHLSDQTHFTYSVSNPPVPDTLDAVDWLLKTHAGYCTYYASAMTIMARQLGIPARVVNGFSTGHLDPAHHIWVVNGDDAHSWVQAYLPGLGWITFDPTPGFAPAGSSAPASPSPTPPPVTPSPTYTAAHPTPGPHPTRVPPTSPDPGQGATPGDTGQQGLLLGLSLVLVLFSLVVLFVAIGTYWWRNLYANSPLIAAMYWRVCRIASWAGFSPQRWQTPYEYSRLLGRNFPREAAPLWRLTQRFVQNRWAPPQQAPAMAQEEALENLAPNLRRMFWRSLWLKIRKK